MPKLDDVDRITAGLMRGEFFNTKDEDEQECDRLAKEVFAGLNSDNPKTKVTAMRVGDKYVRTAVIRMLHKEDDPKWVPIRHIKHAIQYPAIPHERNFSRPEQRASIDGPTRAIRVVCLECQGGDNAGVRECAATNCPLWAFRMGHNPFYGRLTDSEATAEETDAEIEAMEAQRAPDPTEINDAG